jgi:pimeloyl-ACP methyl ester carboxylesterase
LTDEECEIIREASFPVGAITGDSDRLIYYTNTISMVHSLGAKVKIIEGCDHGIIVEAADILNQWIEQFVTEGNADISLPVPKM